MNSNLTSFICNHCGAPLKVQPGTRFCTCTYCNSHLKIREEGGTIFSEVLSDLQDRTARIDENVQAIRAHQELEMLDREWAMEERRLSTAKKDGSHAVPNKNAAIGIGSFVAIFGVIWTGITIAMGAPGFFPVFGMVFVGFAIFAIVTGVKRAEEYEQKKRIHDQRREEIMRRIEEQRRR